MSILKRLFSYKRETFENIVPDDIVIVIIGPTGVGKSMFINTAVGEKLLEVEKKSPDGQRLVLEPCTKEFAYVRCTFEDSRRVVFVDTPAFPDPNDASTSISAQKEMAKKINSWLKKYLGKRIKVTGILYLHRITDNRLTEQLPHYNMFQQLCGEEYLPSLILVLTMWENILDPELGRIRKEYLTKHWKDMVGKNAAVYAHSGTKQSAWEVVKALGVL